MKNLFSSPLCILNIILYFLFLLQILFEVMSMLLIKYIILCRKCNNYFNHIYSSILNTFYSNYYLILAFIYSKVLRFPGHNFEFSLFSVQVKIRVILGFKVFFRSNRERNDGFLQNTINTFQAVQGTFRSLEIHSERRYKIFICSVILGELKYFQNYRGFSIIFPKFKAVQFNVSRKR